MTKTKDFVSARPHAASLSDESKQRHTFFVQEKKLINQDKDLHQNVQDEKLSSQDFDDSGTLVFTSFDALPANKVQYKRECLLFQELKIYNLRAFI